MLTNLAPDRVATLMDWLYYDIERARADRAQLDQDWLRFQEVYRARPDPGIKEFPFRGAANLKIQVAATDIDTTVAGIMGVLYSSPNLWSCEALKPEMLDFAPRLEEFLEWAQEQELGMYGTVRDFVIELCKLGTSVVKQRYSRQQKKMFEWRETPQGVIQQMTLKLASNHPEVSHVSLPNFWVPSTVTELKYAPWCAERLVLTWQQIDARIRAGLYRPDTMDRLGAYWRANQGYGRAAMWGNQPSTPYQFYQQGQERLDHFTPSLRDTFEIFEFWPTFDIDGDGEPEELVCTIHLPTRTYLRIDYNPFFHQEKPYSVARFMVQEDRFYGIGLCEMLEMPQIEVSTMHCQRIDNGTIRNTALFKAKRGGIIKADEPVWPGRFFLVDNPQTDIEPMQMGYPAESTIPEEELLINYARQRSGVSTYEQGGAGNPAISYSTATTTIQMIQQGRLKLDGTLREIQRALTETGQRVTEMYQQFNQQGKPYQVMGDKDGAAVTQILSFPLDTIRLGVAVKVTATTSQLNKQTRIQTDQVIYALVTQFYQQLFQGMTVVVNPQVPPQLRILAAQMIQGGLVLARRILDAYDLQDIDRIVPDMEQLNNVTQQLTAGFGAQPQLALGPGPGAGAAGMGAGAPNAPGIPVATPGTAGAPQSGIQPFAFSR